MALPRPSGGVTGAPGPGGLAGTASQPVMTGGPNPSQLGQPGGSVTLGIVQGPGGVVGVGGLGGDTTAGPATTSATAGKQTRRRFALDIVDPKTMKNIDVYDGSVTSSSTPPHSGESSARDTPQPVSTLLRKLRQTCVFIFSSSLHIIHRHCVWPSFLMSVGNVLYLEILLVWSQNMLSVHVSIYDPTALCWAFAAFQFLNPMHSSWDNFSQGL